MSQQVSFVVDEQSLKAIEELKQTFGVTSNAAVVRKALGLARIAAKNAGEDNTLTIVDQKNRSHKVMLSG
jgi:transaldolase